MPDTKTAVSAAAPETTAGVSPSARFRISRDTLDARCTELGAHSEDERAQLMGVNRTTLHRWTVGSNTPSTAVIESVCERLDLTREALFPGIATPAPVQTIAEAAAKVAANWPALTADQKDELSRIFAPIVQAEKLERRRPARRAA